MADDLKLTKVIIVAYLLFVLIGSSIGLISYTNLIQTLPDVTGINFLSFIGIFGTIINIIWVVLTFTITEYPFISVILWGFRLIAILELLIYGKRLVHPTQI